MPEHAHEARQTRNRTTRDPFVALSHATRTYKLLQGYSGAEQEWVHAELQRWAGDELLRRQVPTLDRPAGVQVQVRKVAAVLALLLAAATLASPPGLRLR